MRISEPQRTGANARPDSTSWGSLVRAQYRPLTKALLKRGFFVQALNAECALQRRKGPPWQRCGSRKALGPARVAVCALSSALQAGGQRPNDHLDPLPQCAWPGWAVARAQGCSESWRRPRFGHLHTNQDREDHAGYGGSVPIPPRAGSGGRASPYNYRLSPSSHPPATAPAASTSTASASSAANEQHLARLNRASGLKYKEGIDSHRHGGLASAEHGGGRSGPEQAE